MARLNSWVGTESEILSCMKSQKYIHCKRASAQTCIVSMTVEAEELAEARLCPAKDPGATPPRFPEEHCCQEPVSIEANSPLCFPLSNAFKKFPRACIWHKLRCYSQVPRFIKTQVTHLFCLSLLILASWEHKWSIRLLTMVKRTCYPWERFILIEAEEILLDASFRLQYFSCLLHIQWLYSLRTKWWQYSMK